MKQPPVTVATEQIDTRLTTTREIMGSVGFAAGVADVRTGAPARFDSSFDADDIWTYERGRLWAYLADSSGRRNTLTGVAMNIRKRRSDRSGRVRLFSPGRPPVAGREARRRFWAAIAAGTAVKMLRSVSVCRRR